MSVDRFGSRIIIGWEDHEDLWIKAAITLPCSERTEAFLDIASMTGRTLPQVRERASAIRAKQRKDAETLANLKAYPRRILVPGTAVRGHAQISWTPDRQKLMGAR